MGGGRGSEIDLLSGREFSFEPDLSDTALIGPKFEFEGKWGSVGIWRENLREIRKFLIKFFKHVRDSSAVGVGKWGGGGARSQDRPKQTFC